jgi:hypothetical protein
MQKLLAAGEKSRHKIALPKRNHAKSGSFCTQIRDYMAKDKRFHCILITLTTILLYKMKARSPNAGVSS